MFFDVHDTPFTRGAAALAVLAAVAAAFAAFRFLARTTRRRIEHKHADAGAAQMAKSLNAAKKIAVPVLFVLGCLLLSLGLYALERAYALVSDGAHAHGAVVRLAALDNGKGIRYYPVVSFTTAEKSVVEFRGHSGNVPAAYQVGEGVPVIYDARNPAQTAVIDEGWANWLLPVFLCAMGAMMFAIASALRKKISSF